MKRTRSKAALKRTVAQFLPLKRASSKIPKQISISYASNDAGGIVGGFPCKSKIVTMRYAREFTLNPGAGGAAVEQVFRCNSLYDPDYSGAGAQPYGFDQWNLIYNAFVVLRSRIKCTAWPVNSGSTSGIFGICLTQGTTAVGTTIMDVAEKNTSSSIASLSNQVSIADRTARSSCDVARFFDKKNPQDDENLVGNGAGNPVTQGYFHVWAMGIGGTDADSCNFTCQMEFDVQWMDPVVPAYS